MSFPFQGKADLTPWQKDRYNERCVGSSAAIPTSAMTLFRAPVAQWIEHQTTDLGVTGSTPVGRATFHSLSCHSLPTINQEGSCKDRVPDLLEPDFTSHGILVCYSFYFDRQSPLQPKGG